MDGDNGRTAGATLIDSTAWRSDGRASDKMGASEHPDFVMGGQLTDDQRNDLMELLADFNDVFDSAVPGLTNLTMHTIQLNDETPCWQPPYMIPEGLGDAVENEQPKNWKYRKKPIT